MTIYVWTFNHVRKCILKLRRLIRFRIDNIYKEESVIG